MKGYWLPLFQRTFILLIVSIVAVAGISELSYWVLRGDNSRPPESVELVIPAGTAERVARGSAVPSIPDALFFVAGDILVVRNEDSVNHELGPLFIPPGSVASLELRDANEYSYNCTFQPSNSFDLTVREAITWESRLGALTYGVPSTLMFLLVYSFAVRPLKRSGSSETA